MFRKSMSFDFHGLLSMNVNLNKRSFLDRIDYAYSFFEKGKSTSAPDLEVNVGKFKPEKKDCLIEDDGRFYIKEGYLHSKDSYKLASWAFEIFGLDEKKTVLNVDCNPFGHLFYSAYLVEFLINLKLNFSGHPMIHSAAVEKDGKSFLFAARSGVGKTMLTLNLVKNGFGFLGDNWSVLSKEKTLCFPCPLNIFYYHVGAMDNIGAFKGKFDGKKMQIFGAKLLYKLSGGYAKIYTQIKSHELLSESLVDGAKTRALFFMVPGESFKIKDCGNRGEITRLLLLNNRLEAFPFSNYLLEYSFAFPESPAARHWEILEKNISRSLSKSDLFFVSIPKKFSPEFARKVSSFICDNL